MDYDLENFSLLKTKLKTILRGFNLSKGNKTDVLLNFEKLKELEKQLWAIGMETRYESLSPKINTSAMFPFHI